MNDIAKYYSQNSPHTRKLFAVSSHFESLFHYENFNNCFWFCRDIGTMLNFSFKAKITLNRLHETISSSLNEIIVSFEQDYSPVEANAAVFWNHSWKVHIESVSTNSALHTHLVCDAHSNRMLLFLLVLDWRWNFYERVFALKNYKQLCFAH